MATISIDGVPFCECDEMFANALRKLTNGAVVNMLTTPTIEVTGPDSTFRQKLEANYTFVRTRKRHTVTMRFCIDSESEKVKDELTGRYFFEPSP